MICEVCGAVVDIVYEVIYKGNRGFACKECINKYGLIRIRKGTKPPTRVNRPVAISPSRKVTASVRRRSKGLMNVEEELVEDYGSIIKRARESIGLTQEQLAKKLGIKLSYLKKIENGLIPPPIALAKKIERILNIRIVARVDELVEEPASVEDEYEDVGLTLGDLLRREEW